MSISTSTEAVEDRAVGSQPISSPQVLPNLHAHSTRAPLWSPRRANPVAQAVGLLHNARTTKLRHEAIVKQMTCLARQFRAYAAAADLGEVAAWCETCRQLDYTAPSDHLRRELADAVTCALEDRVAELDDTQLPAVLWVLANADQPLGEALETALVDRLLDVAPRLPPGDLMDVAESANRLALCCTHPELASRLVHAAVAQLPSVGPEAAVHLCRACLPSALPHHAPERSALLGSLCRHLADQSEAYDTFTLLRALKLVGGLAAGQEALLSYVRSIQGMVCHAYMRAAEQDVAASRRWGALAC